MSDFVTADVVRSEINQLLVDIEAAGGPAAALVAPVIAYRRAQFLAEFERSNSARADAARTTPPGGG